MVAYDGAEGRAVVQQEQEQDTAAKAAAWGNSSIVILLSFFVAALTGVCGWSGSNVFYGANIAADMSSQCTVALHRGEIELRTQCGGGFVIARHVAAVGNRGR